jgi:hypothetical protein
MKKSPQLKGIITFPMFRNFLQHEEVHRRPYQSPKRIKFNVPGKSTHWNHFSECIFDTKFLFLFFYFFVSFNNIQAQVPGVPNNLTALPINNGAVIRFTPPVSLGATISNYAYSIDNGSSWIECSPSVKESPIIINNGLVNCTQYSLKIRAINLNGYGSESNPVSVIPTSSAMPGTIWTTGVTNDNQWVGVTYGKGLFVAVSQTGSNNRVMTSPNGLTWTSRTTPTNQWQSVCYGNGIFVAVANNNANRVMTSTDGITWSPRNVPLNTWTRVTYGNGLFVAVGNSSTTAQVMTSSDGITWTARAAANTNQWQSVTYGNGLFVAVAFNGTGNQIMTSPNGINWTAQSTPANNQWRDITFGNGLFVAVGQTGVDNRVMTSADGITWTTRLATSNIQWRGVTFGNGLFVAVSQSRTLSGIMTSPDGINWSSVRSAADINWQHVAYGQGQFVAVASTGSGNRAMTSRFGVSPNAPVISSLTSGNTNATVSFSNSLFNDGNTLAISGMEYSSDSGLTWNRSIGSINSPMQISGLASGNYDIRLRALNSAGASCPSNAATAQISVGYDLPNAPNNLNATGINNGAYITFDAPSNTGSVNSPAGIVKNYEYSLDGGLNWIACSPITTNSPVIIQQGLTNCVASSIQIRAVNAEGTGASSSSITVEPCLSTGIMETWFAQNAATDNQWFSVTYGNGLFVAVARSGTGNRVMTSPDGINWTSRTSAADNFWRSVTFGNGLFVAVAGLGTNRVMTSPDGINWTARLSAVETNQWNSVIYANGQFVAVGQIGYGNRVMTSSDGINWTARSSANDNAWRSVAFGNGRYVAVSNTGNGNRVMISEDGAIWSSVNTPANNNWESICYGNNMFVAVASSGNGNRVMTSPDGIVWTLRNSAADNNWVGLTYGNGLFVAVAGTGSGNRIMSSADGIQWTSNNSIPDSSWTGIAYGNGRFVAVSASSTGNKVLVNMPQLLAPTPVIDNISVIGSDATVSYTANYASSLPIGIETADVTAMEYSIDNGATWSGASFTSTSSPITITNLTPGTYEVRLRVISAQGAGCSSNAVTVIVPGLTNRGQLAFSDFSVQLYPNPTSNELNVRYFSKVEMPIVLELLDGTGRIVFHRDNSTYPGENQFNFSMKNLSNGLYFVRIVQGNNAVFSGRIAKQN